MGRNECNLINIVELPSYCSVCAEKKSLSHLISYYRYSLRQADPIMNLNQANGDQVYNVSQKTYDLHLSIRCYREMHGTSSVTCTTQNRSGMSFGRIDLSFRSFILLQPQPSTYACTKGKLQLSDSLQKTPMQHDGTRLCNSVNKRMKSVYKGT